MLQRFPKKILANQNVAFLESLIRSDDELVAASAFGALRFLSAPPLWNEKLLAFGASHRSQHVRREAALCASYLVPSESNPNSQIKVAPQNILKAISPLLEQPGGMHLSYAITSAFHSDGFEEHWLPDTAEKLKKFAPPKRKKNDPRSKKERAFDRQKNLTTIKIGTIPERLLFTKNKFSVKVGQPVRLIFSNPDATDHNLLLLAKDTSVQEIGEAANEMARDPEAAKKHYIPDDKRIIHATRMLKKGQSQTLRFTAPKIPGNYPYVCTFPGHWAIMRGVMEVTAEK
jgi:uncharacterized cupredoxin-like copper-binding protein